MGSIQKAIDAKKEAERQIKNIIAQYEADHGLKVNEIVLNRVTISNFNQVHTRVELDVRL